MNSESDTNTPRDESNATHRRSEWIWFAVVLLLLIVGGYVVAAFAAMIFASEGNIWGFWLPFGGWGAAIATALIGAGVAFRTRRSPWVGMPYAAGIFFVALFAALLVLQA